MMLKLCGNVYDINTTGSKEFGDNTITIKINYEPGNIEEGEQPIYNQP